MAAIGLIAGLIGGGFTLAGSQIAADAARKQGAAEQQTAYYNAGMEQRSAMAERAGGQRKAFEQRRQEQLVQSSLQAKAAASGGSATDPTVTALASQITGESEFRALGDMWSGETRARGLEDQAGLDKWVGDVKRDQGELRAQGLILGGYGGMLGSLGGAFSKFKGVDDLTSAFGFG